MAKPIRHEVCHECKVSIPVFQYAYMNHDDYSRVYVNGQSAALCVRDWNKCNRQGRLELVDSPATGVMCGWVLKAEVAA